MFYSSPMNTLESIINLQLTNYANKQFLIIINKDQYGVAQFK